MNESSFFVETYLITFSNKGNKLGHTNIITGLHNKYNNTVNKV